MAAPFGRAPVLSTDLVFSVPASSQAMLADPRLVTRISPSSATAPATPGNPDSVAMCPASGSITSRHSRGVGDEDPAGLGIEGTVIEFAARGVRYLDDTKGFQRHDDLVPLSDLCRA